MSDANAGEIGFVYKPHGTKGTVSITVELPHGTPVYTDKIDVTRLRQREAFLDKVLERHPGLDRSGSREQLERIAAEIVSGSPEGSQGLDGLDDVDGSAGSVSDRLVALALAKFRLGRSTKNEPFAVPLEGPKCARLLRPGNSLFRSELANDFYRESKKVPGGTALTDAMQVLIGKAMEAGPEELHLRVAPHGDGVVLDLADEAGTVVVVSPGGWKATTESPVLFRRTQLTGRLPVPVHDGDLEELTTLLNVSRETWPLVVGNLAAAMIPDINHPVMLLGGQHGTGKSTGARIVAEVIDPGPAVLRTPPRDVEQWAMNATASWVVVVDNVSRIPDWWSDALCRAATGDGLVRRQLYTDEDLSVLAFRRVVMLTSIDAGALKGDLGDRILLVDLRAISGEDREYEKDLWARYREAHPRVLGGLLDLVAKVLAVLPSIELRDKSRMADFHRVLAAVDVVLGIGAADCYLRQRERIAVEVVESDSLAETLRAWIEQKGEWEGTAGQLLEILSPQPVPKGWPNTPRGLGGRLRRLVPSLLQLGIEVVPPSDDERSKDPKRERLFRIRFQPKSSEPTVQTVQPSKPEADPTTTPGLDGLDGLDDCARDSCDEEVCEWTG